MELPVREKSWSEKLDVSAYGFFTGLLIPVVVFFVLYFALYSYIPFSEYITLGISSETLQIILKAGVVANLPVFLLFNILKRFLFCRGMFYSSLIYIMIIFYLRFLA